METTATKQYHALLDVHQTEEGIALIKEYEYPLMYQKDYICTKFIENDFYRFCQTAS